MEDWIIVESMMILINDDNRLMLIGGLKGKYQNG